MGTRPQTVGLRTRLKRRSWGTPEAPPWGALTTEGEAEEAESCVRVLAAVTHTPVLPSHVTEEDAGSERRHGAGAQSHPQAQHGRETTPLGHVQRPTPGNTGGSGTTGKTTCGRRRTAASPSGAAHTRGPPGVRPPAKPRRGTRGIVGIWRRGEAGAAGRRPRGPSHQPSTNPRHSGCGPLVGVLGSTG